MIKQLTITKRMCWMTEYILAIKQKLLNVHSAKIIGGTKDDPLIEIADGEYNCEIDGRTDCIKIVSGRIDCCNFDLE